MRLNRVFSLGTMEMAAMICISSICFCQPKVLIVVDLQDSVSRGFRNEFKRFDSDLRLLMSDELRLQIISSKSLGVQVKPVSKDSVGKYLRDGYRTNIHLDSLRADLKAVFSKDSLCKYVITGRVTDDKSNIVSVDAEIYERYKDTLRDPLCCRVHVEASQAEAFSNGVSLMSHLVQKIVLEVERELDERIRVLITPFTFHGADERTEHLGPMISALLGSRLNVSPRIRVIEDTIMGRRVGYSSEYRQWTLPELGRREAAKYVIGGSYFRYDTTVGVEANHIDVETGHSVFSKSLLINNITGREFYTSINSLGDEIRNAIELDYDVNHDASVLTVAVVPVPPFPATRENKTVVLEISKTISRMLKELRPQTSRRLSVVTSEHKTNDYIDNETDVAIMARDMNAQYLWVVRCERPSMDFHITMDIYDVKGSASPWSFPLGRGVPPERLNTEVRRIVDTIVVRLFRTAVDTSRMDSQIAGIGFRPPEMSIAVVPVPPYPNTSEDRGITTDVAGIVSAELSEVPDAVKKFVVIPSENSFEQYMDMERFDRDSVAHDLQCQYLWLVDFKKIGHVRHVQMKLVHIGNPYDSVISKHFTIDHIDNLSGQVKDAAREMLRTWLHEPVKDTSSKETDTQAVLDLMSYRTESAGIRVRGSLLGLIPDSKAVFLGNTYRYAIEVSAIYYRRPMQFEFMFTYDFGKRGTDILVYGRYISLLARFNFASSILVRDLRTYVGAGFTAFNVVRVTGSVYGSMNLGIVLTGGFEIPTSRNLFFDLNGQFYQPFDRTLRGAAPQHFGEGWITSFSFGFGIGYRLK